MLMLARPPRPEGRRRTRDLGLDTSIARLCKVVGKRMCLIARSPHDLHCVVQGQAVHHRAALVELLRFEHDHAKFVKVHQPVAQRGSQTEVLARERAIKADDNMTYACRLPCRGSRRHSSLLSGVELDV